MTYQRSSDFRKPTEGHPVSKTFCLRKPSEVLLALEDLRRDFRFQKTYCMISDLKRLTEALPTSEGLFEVCYGQKCFSRSSRAHITFLVFPWLKKTIHRSSMIRRISEGLLASRLFSALVFLKDFFEVFYS